MCASDSTEDTGRQVPAWRMRVTPRWSDLDPLGHVHHLAYLRWCEDARNEHAVYTGLPEPGSGAKSQVVVSMTCCYSHPIGRSERPTVSMQVVRVGTTSMETYFSIDTTRQCFSARAITVACDDRTGQPVRWTETERAALAGQQLAPL